MSLTDRALSTMGYFILRLAYADTIGRDVPCPGCLYLDCDSHAVYEDVIGEVEVFLGSLAEEGNTDARRRFFDLFADELSSGIYLDSERIANACPPGVAPHEFFRARLMHLVHYIAHDPEVIRLFNDIFDDIIATRTQGN